MGGMVAKFLSAWGFRFETGYEAVQPQFNYRREGGNNFLPQDSSAPSGDQDVEATLFETQAAARLHALSR